MIDLYGRKFEGRFFRNPEYVDDDMKYLKMESRRMKGNPEVQEINQKLQENKKKYEFDFLITNFDPQTGLFTATTNDHFGRGVAMGGVTSDFMKFLKAYSKAGMTNLHLSSLVEDFISDRGNFAFFEYSGRIFEHHGDSLEIVGSYKNLHENKRSGGTWEMETV